jgi:hypothetical protein
MDSWYIRSTMTILTGTGQVLTFEQLIRTVIRIMYAQTNDANTNDDNLIDALMRMTDGANESDRLARIFFIVKEFRR